MKNKKLGVLLLAALMMSNVVVPQPVATVKAAEADVAANSVAPAGTTTEPAEGNIETADKFVGQDDLNVVFSQKTHLVQGSGAVNNYFKFTVNEDSWVFLGSSLSLNNHDGVSVKYALYADAAFSKKVGTFEAGYWKDTSKQQLTAILKKGTYYVSILSKHENYGDFDGNINVVGVAVPVKKIVKTSYKVNKDKKSATVTFSTAMGDFFKYAQYRYGKVGRDGEKNANYWGYLNSVGWNNSTDRNAIQLKLNADNTVKFKVKRNGYYTIRVTDKTTPNNWTDAKEGTSYSAFFKVKGIVDKKAPVVSVVNGRTYRGSVRITFSDKDSGVKSAKLNGKTIKSGHIAYLSGRYTLVVKDYAGNTTKVSFRVR